MLRKFSFVHLTFFALFALSFLPVSVDAATRKPSKPAKAESKKQALILQSPPGWVLDTKSAASKGIHLAFYPKGGSWQNSDAIMYADGSALHGKNFSGEQFIAEDISHFRSKEKGLKVNKLAPIKLNSGHKVPVYRFEFPSRKALEEIAYIEDNKSMVIVVLSTRSAESLAGSQAAFRSLVTSYQMNKIETTVARSEPSKTKQSAKRKQKVASKEPRKKHSN